MPIVSPPRRPAAAAATVPDTNPLARIRLFYGVLLVVCAVFVVRLFYLQVIKHDYYHKAALSGQLKEYEIPAPRGTIRAHDGSNATPIVLNETLYTVFADPKYIKHPDVIAKDLQPIIGGNAADIAKQLSQANTRYVVLSKRLSKEQKQKIDALDYLGIGTREESYRTYPQGQLASQVLGFVNSEGQGQYGLEQYLDAKLRGKPGLLKAITDARGVPLVSNKDNIVTDAKAGTDVTLTLDIGMQRHLEDILKAGLEHAQSKSGGALIMESATGAIKAMANYPTYDPSKLADVKDLAVLGNPLVSSPLEVGSIMKTLTASAALDSKSLTLQSSFEGVGSVMVGDRKITDVQGGVGTQTVASTLQNSLNTGAVWMLKRMGNGEINAQARQTFYDYLTKHFFLGVPTGIEQVNEAGGDVPEPTDNGRGINVTYANMAFGQGLTNTPLQIAAAFNAAVNGGSYYQPHLVERYVDNTGNTTMVKSTPRATNVVSASTSESLMGMLETVARGNSPGAMRSGYRVGGKTGSAQFASPDGGYYKDRFNGTYVGFVGGDKPQYIIIVRVNDPKIVGYAGSAATAPIFKDLSNMLIDNFGVTPKSK